MSVSLSRRDCIDALSVSVSSLYEDCGEGFVLLGEDASDGGAVGTVSGPVPGFLTCL